MTEEKLQCNRVLRSSHDQDSSHQLHKGVVKYQPARRIHWWISNASPDYWAYTTEPQFFCKSPSLQETTRDSPKTPIRAIFGPRRHGQRRTKMGSSASHFIQKALRSTMAGFSSQTIQRKGDHVIVTNHARASITYWAGCISHQNGVAKIRKPGSTWQYPPSSEL